LLVFIIVFGVVFASIPIGAAVGLFTIYLLNSFDLANMPLNPGTSAWSTTIISACIFISAVYMFLQVRRESVRSFDSGAIFKAFMLKPAIYIGIYLIGIVLIGIF
jgi:hypothetical protein